MIGHLGARVSALLDGQMPPQEAERAWEHVHACHPCRDLVEREGWIKTRLSGLGAPGAVGAAPDALKGLLKHDPLGSPWPPSTGSPLAGSPAARRPDDRPRRGALALAALGGGAAGAAVMGVLTFGASAERPAPTPPSAPTVSVRVPGTGDLVPVRRLVR